MFVCGCLLDVFVCYFDAQAVTLLFPIIYVSAKTHDKAAFDVAMDFVLSKVLEM